VQDAILRYGTQSIAGPHSSYGLGHVSLDFISGYIGQMTTDLVQDGEVSFMFSNKTLFIHCAYCVPKIYLALQFIRAAGLQIQWERRKRLELTVSLAAVGNAQDNNLSSSIINLIDNAIAANAEPPTIVVSA